MDIKLKPQDLLPVGTEVVVKGEKGIVVEAGWATDQHGGRICLHKVRFATGERYVNYSFIYAKS